MDRKEKWIRIRIRMVGLFFLLAFCLVTGRAYFLQVHAGDMWRKRADQQHQKVIPLAPQRGTIYDRDGQELAVSIETDSIYAEPGRVKDPAGAARQLAKALNLSSHMLLKKLQSQRGFVWLKRRLTPVESARVEALNITGIGFTKEHKRYYPNSEIGAQIVGFTGLDPEGLEGLELRYDAELLGDGGYLLVEQDALGRRMTAGNNVVREGELGHSIHLTIDRNLQYIAEKELAAQVRESQARAGTLVMLEAASGRVLAMASQPDFNPNNLEKYRPAQWRNRAVCDTFEPGSTFKVFLLAAALQEGIVQPQQSIYCENGRFRFGGRTINDHHPYEDLTVTEILKFSSNIGSAKIGKALERDRLYDYIKRFGFGTRTGIDLPGEVSGLLRPPSRWFEIDLATISFGQGISVTALQLAAATAAIANDGKLMAPYLVEQVVDSHGSIVRQTRPELVRQVVSADVSRTVRQMMASVTEEGGTGTLAAVPGYRVAGKTGTAQKVDLVTGGYSPDKRIASFAGFVPAEDPRIVMVVVIDEPQGKTYGGLIAAPVFSRVAAQSLRYLGLSPTQPRQEDYLPPVLEVDTQPVLGPMPRTAAEPQNEHDAMPDLRGMTYRQVLQVMERTGLNIKLEGSGRVVEQSPSSGRPIRYETKVRVRLADAS